MDVEEDVEEKVLDVEEDVEEEVVEDVEEEMVQDVEEEMVQDVEEEVVVVSPKSVYRMLEAVVITAKETVKERKHLKYSKR
ncbi:unnamed protein product [Onchocerca flexuosa]|uniref:Ovule protein n=1 Tax=Onchocerca flexuosa TaxID=387005 RepID=A0A183HY73_9BILA|nr:unnamed protein product [Onchocerca flexuosa]